MECIICQTDTVVTRDVPGARLIFGIQPREIRCSKCGRGGPILPGTSDAAALAIYTRNAIKQDAGI